MKEKDITLFNKAIHNIKYIMVELTEERDLYRRVMLKLATKHDTKINKMLTEAKEVLDEMYELFDDLTDKGGK